MLLFGQVTHILVLNPFRSQSSLYLRKATPMFTCFFLACFSLWVFLCLLVFTVSAIVGCAARARAVIDNCVRDTSWLWLVIFVSRFLQMPLGALRGGRGTCFFFTYYLPHVLLSGHINSFSKYYIKYFFNNNHHLYLEVKWIILSVIFIQVY